MKVYTHVRPAAYAALISLGVATFTFPASAQEELDTLNTDDTQTSNLTLAEDAPMDESPAPTPEKKRASLDEIVVTAQKRAEDIQDVPLSVSAIGGETLKEKNIGNMQEVADEVPNLHIESGANASYIYMRGIGSGYNRGFEQSVAIIIDDVFYGRPSYLNNGLLDLYAIEVLRGPQGTLFGKNSTAGVVHLRTANPEPEWAMDADAMLGAEDSQYRYRVALQGPIFSDDLSFRLALSQDHREGHIFNATRKTNEKGLLTANARMKIRWEPSGTFNTVLSVNGATMEQHGDGTELLKILPRHKAAMAVFDSTVDDDHTDAQSNTDHPGESDRETWDVTSNTNWDVFGGDYTITNVLNYAKMDEDTQFDADFSPIPFITLNNNENFEQISEELRITSPPGTFEYVAGLYFYQSEVIATFDIGDYLTLEEIGFVTGQVDQQYDDEVQGRAAGIQICQRQFPDQALTGCLDSLNGNFGTPMKLETSFTTFTQKSTSYAMFGQGTWHITDDFGLTVGLRGTIEEKKLDYVHILLNNVTGQTGTYQDNPLGTTAFPVIQSGNVQFSDMRVRNEYDISPKGSLTYQWNDDVMTYFTYARGFKSGGYNAQALNPETLEYESEQSDVYEVGIKSEWLDGAARLNVSAFTAAYDDLQTTAFNGTTFVVVNAATAEINGVEFEGAIVPAEFLMISFSGAWTDATFDSFPTGPCPAEQDAEFPNFITNLAGVTSPGVCDLSGEMLINVPEWTGNIDVAFMAPLFNLPVNFMAAVGVNYTSEIFNSLDHDPFDMRPANALVRARIGVRDVDDMWHFTVFGSNLTDVDDIYTTADVPTFVGSHDGQRFPKRRITAELGVRF